jgi:hypothetical protein
MRVVSPHCRLAGLQQSLVAFPGANCMMLPTLSNQASRGVRASTYRVNSRESVGVVGCQSDLQ